MTELPDISPPCPRLSDAAAVVACLRSGGLVAHPTESLLGIAADPLHSGALQALDRLKQRQGKSGYVLAAGTVAQALAWVDSADEASARLLSRNWPGPVTIVAQASTQVPEGVRAADGTVALRVDRHPACRAIGQALGHPWVSTSLNLAGQPPARTWPEVAPELWQALSGWFPVDPPPRGVASTVARVTAGRVEVLRAGEVPAKDLQAALAQP